MQNKYLLFFLGIKHNTINSSYNNPTNLNNKSTFLLYFFERLHMNWYSVKLSTNQKDKLLQIYFILLIFLGKKCILKQQIQSNVIKCNKTRNKGGGSTMRKIF